MHNACENKHYGVPDQTSRLTEPAYGKLELPPPIAMQRGYSLSHLGKNFVMYRGLK